MRIYAISDLHIDYEQNLDWVRALSKVEYQNDILLLAGDISDDIDLVRQCFDVLLQKFYSVCFVPGNHDLWTFRNDRFDSSFEKHSSLMSFARSAGLQCDPYHIGGLSIVPIQAWYDFSFGEPSEELLDAWMDFRACQWGDGFSQSELTEYFLAENRIAQSELHSQIISFSHFLPRIDLMPIYIPEHFRYLYPALGSILIDRLVRNLGSKLHIYGHSHVNRDVVIDGVRYVNNAFGYPGETRISAKALKVVHEFV